MFVWTTKGVLDAIVIAIFVISIAYLIIREFIRYMIEKIKNKWKNNRS